MPVIPVGAGAAGAPVLRAVGTGAAWAPAVSVRSARGAVPVTDPGPADMDEGASGDGAGKDSKSGDKKSDEKGSGSSPQDT